ncbi:sialin-like [Tribolium madens]|uniref:sialin-like n=1 Tax=Tribolium madens TaxID=41895 RepID=UPI001CF73E68|nr:sialin-like [Tribolium madens]
MNDETDDEIDDSPPRSCPSVPQRYIVTLMVFLVYVSTFSSRDTILVADDYFANIVTINRTHDLKGTCPDLVRKEEENFFQKFEKTVIWKQSDFDSIYTYFHLGYPISNLIGGIFANMYGGKQMVALGLFLASVLTIIIPWYIQVINGSATAMKILSTTYGLCQGLLYPSGFHILAHWVPLSEQTFLIILAYSGLYVGDIISSMCTHLIINAFLNWKTPFYIYGAIGIIVTLLWELLVFSSPNKNPRIQPNERLYLEIEMKGLVDHRPKTIPFSQILTSIPVWAFVVASIGNLWIWNLLSNLVPIYLQEVLKYNDSETRIMSNIPNFALILTMTAMAFFSDWVLHHGYINRLTVRKVFNTIGLMGPPIYMLTASYAGCNRLGAQILFLISKTLTEFICLGSFLMPLDMAPNYCGFLMALGNGFGMFTGFFQDYILHVLVPDGTIGQYRRLAWLALVIAIVTNGVFIGFGSTNLQKWNQVRKIK